MPLDLQQFPGRCQGRGLAGARRALDDQQSAGAGQGGDHPLLGMVELAAGDHAADAGGGRGVLGSGRETGDQVGLDGALLSLGWDDDACVTVVCTPDEEIGSPGSRALLETLGAEHDVALCLERAREDGRVVVGRKGVVDVVLEVRGRSAHAGVEPERGVNAAVAAAGPTADLVALNGRWPDVTVNVGVLRAGEWPNVVPARASLVADVRATSPSSFDEVVAAIRSLADRSSVGGVTVEMFLEAPAPPWVSDPASRRVADVAGDVAAALGIELGFAVTGGAADSNLLAAQGIAVLDGLGPVGGDDHSLTEWLDLDSVVPRVTRLAGLMIKLARSADHPVVDLEGLPQAADARAIR